MLDILLWLLVIELLGVAAFPVAYALFPRLADRGYSLAKPLGLLLIGYPLWLLGSLHLVPSTRGTIIGLVLLLALLSLFLLWLEGHKLLDYLRRERATILLVEGVFLVFFVGWVLYRAYDPGIQGTEKPMDFAFLNASARAAYFPPEDPWLQGHGISYYYFGHLLMGMLTKLTGIPSSISYNLSLALIPAMAASGAFGLTYSLLRFTGARRGAARFFALFAPLFLLLAANLEGILELARIRGWGTPQFWEWLSIKDLTPGSTSTAWVPTDGWWWWKASRLLSLPVDGHYQEIISEFPFFSFLLGDLHPHVMALPFVLLSLAFGLNLVASRDELGWRWVVRNPYWVVTAAISLGALGFINIWDLPTYLAVFGGAAFVAAYRAPPRHPLMLLWRAAPLVGLVAAGAVVLYLPQYLVMESQASFPYLLSVGELASRPVHQIVFWGLFLFILAPLALTQLWKLLRSGQGRVREGGMALAIAFAPFAAWALVELVLGSDASVIIQRLRNLLPWMLLLAVLLYGLLCRARASDIRLGSDTSDSDGDVGLLSVLLLSSFGVLLIIGVELFFVLDFFNSRMNTVFKLYYQAWTLLALSCAFGLYYLGQAWRREEEPEPPIIQIPRLGWALGLWLLLGASLYYAAASLPSKANDFEGDPTLDGLSVVARYAPEEADAIRWLRVNASPDAVLVEAVGGSYTEYGRVSASTGIPSVINWPGHEHQWRGSTKLFEGREEEVARLYTTESVGEAQGIVATYNVQYVVVGPRERTKYGSRGLDKFAQFMEPVFPGEEVTVYRVRE